MAVKAALIACAASVTLARAALCSSYDASSCSSMNDGGCSCYWDSTTCARNESDCSGMGPTSVGDCTLTGGQTVTFGWSGPDTGSNWCNSCSCDSVNLTCTKMGCIGDAPNCTLSDNITVVPHGWAGADLNDCDTCSCIAGLLNCSFDGCIMDDGMWWEDAAEACASTLKLATVGLLISIRAAGFGF
mmetsp:Transcript_967/g.2086  ORF Transcript_967/g.2086 Transcript_967/m.2086 type:complete len:187 (-) Transcript_967:155-715(-)